MTDELAQDSGDSGDTGNAPDGGAPDNGDSGGGDWRAALPDDLRDNATLADVKDVTSLAKMAVDLKAYQGGSLRIPSEDAGEEDWKAFNQKLIDKVPGLAKIDPDNAESVEAIQRTLGKPDEAVKYEMPEIEGIEIPEETVGFLRKTAHELGLTKKQFKEFVGKNLAMDAEQAAALTAARDAGLKELRGEWGAAYEDKVSGIRKMAEITGAPKELVDAVGAGKANAEAMRWLDGLVSRFGMESRAMGDTTGSSTGRLTPTEARERADEILRRLDEIGPGDPQYQTLVNKRFKYIEMANVTD